jgi:phosphatidylglycerol---prolipoprotein diacylglyceryl transferase
MLGWEVIPRIPIGNLSVSPHGVGIAIGYFLGATLMARRARRTGFNEDHAWNAAVVGVLGAIVGARVAYIVGHPEQFRSAVEYLQIYKGGISLMGGLIGGFLAAYLYCRAKKLDFLRLADLGAPGLAIGTAIGRIGDLVIGDHLGTPTDGFWGWEYQGGELISSPPCDPSVYPSPNGCIQPGMVVHQTALYDSLWSLVIFFILMRLDRKPRPKGFLVLTWAALYSIGRILTDLVRVDKTWFGTGLTGSQLTAVVVLVLSLFFLIRLRKARPAVATATAAEEPTEAAEEPAAEAVAAGAEEPVSPVPPVDPEAPEAAAIPVESPAEPEEEAEAAAADAPVSTPTPPPDDVPPVETPPTPPVEAMVVDSQAPAVVDIPPAEQAPPSPAGETSTGAAAVEEIPPPAQEVAAPDNEAPAEATKDDNEPPVDQPATEVLPSEPAAGSTTPSKTETAEQPAAGDVEDELRKDSQEP